MGPMLQEEQVQQINQNEYCSLMNVDLENNWNDVEIKASILSPLLAAAGSPSNDEKISSKSKSEYESDELQSLHSGTLNGKCKRNSLSISSSSSSTTITVAANNNSAVDFSHTLAIAMTNKNKVNKIITYETINADEIDSGHAKNRRRRGRLRYAQMNSSKNRPIDGSEISFANVEKINSNLLAMLAKKRREFPPLFASPLSLPFIFIAFMSKMVKKINDYCYNYMRTLFSVVILTIKHQWQMVSCAATKIKIVRRIKSKKRIILSQLSMSLSALVKYYSKNMRYYWIYGLFIATIILPCHMANGASPLQNKHNAAAVAAGAAADNNVNHHQRGSSSGNALTPVSYPSSSIEDSEFLYPSSQSDEQFDDAERKKPQIVSGNETIKPNVTIVQKTPLFPPDYFTREELENGAVICHIIGVIYMFVALAIVCDEFFVPSLDVIIEKLGITDDVAGATFMAAGGSAPELFTSIIGVFVSFDDVGIGTIVGSAVFNILFVIGMCALFSRTILTLTWWPLFRDCSFYSISLLVLIYFFSDNLIYWWEALILFTIYIAYVGFMKWNQQVERCVKGVLTKNKVTRVRSTDQLMPAGNAANSSETSMATQPGGSVTSRASESRSGPAGGSNSGATGNNSGTAGSTQTGAKFRHGLLQLMIHTIDPLHDDDVPGKVDDKATQLHAIASLKVLLDATKPQRGGATTSAANHVKINLKETALADRPNGNIDTTIDSPQLNARRASWIEQRVKVQTRRFSTKGNEPIEDEPEPLNMAWPSGARKRLTYVLVAPLLVPMWLTLPDTRTPRGKRFFAVTFIGSILWIAAFSYLMVWWANVAGDTARIPPEVMGLTFLAAGTSIPDLITSVIVARKGFGDMAVSSSVGSNIFDVTVGLPIPWLIYGLIYNAPVEVNSVGMVCSITILFMMLLFVVMSIACFRWKMNKGLGLTMFLLYFAFVAVSLMFEYDIIFCPF